MTTMQTLALDTLFYFIKIPNSFNILVCTSVQDDTFLFDTTQLNFPINRKK